MEDYAEQMIQIYETGKDKHDIKWVEKEINRCLLKPLGILRE